MSAAGEVRGHLEVHHVAFVVLDDEEAAAAGLHRLDRRDHLVGRRRREHLAGTGGVQHPAADEAGVQRLVPRAAARDQRHLAGLQLAPADELVLGAERNDVGMGGREAVQALGEDPCRRH